MISLQRSMHSSQMYTPGPAMSFLTCFWLLPQKEHLSRSPPSPIRATRRSFQSGPADQQPVSHQALAVAALPCTALPHADATCSWRPTPLLNARVGLTSRLFRPGRTSPSLVVFILAAVIGRISHSWPCG